MNRYLIQRNIPGAGTLTDAELEAIAAASCEVIAGLDGQVQWIESFVSGDAIVCHYLGESEEAIREHARRGGFPVDVVWQVHRSIDPTTAHQAAEVTR